LLIGRQNRATSRGLNERSVSIRMPRNHPLLRKSRGGAARTRSNET
jgi:hypothetical protein